MSFLHTLLGNMKLSNRTSIFGLQLWVVIGIVIGAVILLILFLLSLCVPAFRRRRRSHRRRSRSSGTKGKLRRSVRDPRPAVSKEIQAINRDSAANQRSIAPQVVSEIQIDTGKVEHRVVFSDKAGSSSEIRATSGAEMGSYRGIGSLPEVSHLGWGRSYTLRELEAACNGFSDENVIGEGGYGIVYYGELTDNTRIAVKNLLNNRGQAENEFKAEVGAIGRASHKNLVRLLGYCVEEASRMVVYEYVENGYLDHWLHGDVGEVSPLTWEIRVNIIIGTAKGLAYLHDGLEPKGADFLHCFASYVAPEYVCTGLLNEKSDVYSFGVLIMEIITGRSPADYLIPQGEANLVDWLKMMVGNMKSEEVADPKLPERPASMELKRLLLVALRCVDPDDQKRPKMGYVVHMLESEDFLSLEVQPEVSLFLQSAKFAGTLPVPWVKIVIEMALYSLPLYGRLGEGTNGGLLPKAFKSHLKPSPSRAVITHGSHPNAQP
ncbi:hypothetical protein SASPL_102647 [Salvia splendens]|uniref:non-specific serine/threonine protein kinase n=1 Tax=Salvia splendens TaxID=180675 RepID=A0A8X8YSC0_SALSN|nr:hypothetical protein SASPL_102647 [Salvia splendens]